MGSSVGKLSASQAGSNPGGGLTWFTQCMNEKGEEITSCKSHIASVSLTDWVLSDLKNKNLNFFFFLN